MFDQEGLVAGRVRVGISVCALLAASVATGAMGVAPAHAASEDFTVAGEYADRMVLLARGLVVATGVPRDVLTESLLSEHYGARVRVIPGEHGPLIVPVRAADRWARRRASV